MRRVVTGALLVGLIGLVAPSSGATVSRDPVSRAVAPRPVSGTTCRVFPANNWWHADVSRLPVDARSRAWLSRMRTERDLHPDFGPSYGDGPDYGIPVTVVRGSHRKVPVRFDYRSESDRERYPLGADTRIEGGRGSAGDKHAVVVDRSDCKLYETWLTPGSATAAGAPAPGPPGSCQQRLRPDGWTSADAAGLPILPGLLRWNEVRAGKVDHAIRFTTDATAAAHLWPARHDAGSGPALAYPPWARASGCGRRTTRPAGRPRPRWWCGR